VWRWRFRWRLINASALSEFSQAVRSVNGQPDLELRAAQGSWTRLYARSRTDPRVAVASPVLEMSSTYALDTQKAGAPLRMVGWMPWRWPAWRRP
jgi:putative ABC transport system permease protein